LGISDLTSLIKFRLDVCCSNRLLNGELPSGFFVSYEMSRELVVIPVFPADEMALNNRASDSTSACCRLRTSLLFGHSAFVMSNLKEAGKT
jgi:hypothetical protein